MTLCKYVAILKRRPPVDPFLVLPQRRKTQNGRPEATVDEDFGNGRF